jgi:hypothetical protein
MEVTKTSLSVGEVIREILMESKDVTDITEEIFPVVTEEAELPYIYYVRTGIEANRTKTKDCPAEGAIVEVNCLAATHDEALTLAEAVRDALDGVSGVTSDGRHLRRSELTNASQTFSDDAYIEVLTFKLMI